MKLFTRTLFFVLVIVFFGLPVLLSAQTTTTVADELSFELEEEFKAIYERYKVKGLAAGVVFNDGSVWDIASGSHGSDGLLSDEMLFEIGSNTKTYTAAIILQMASEGKLTLNDTIGKFLDTTKYVDMGATIKQLLNHTSGIYSYTNHPDFGPAVLGDDLNKVVMPDEILTKYMGAQEFAAGTDWSYSNTNYLLLGLIIEKVDGISYHESLRKRIFEPFGLEHSYLDIFESYDEPRSGVWLPSGAYNSDPLRGFMSSAWAAGGIVSTTADLANWAKMLYTNRVLNEAWTDSMKTMTKIDGKSVGYGLGMFYRKFKGHELFGHGGTTLQHSTMEYSPDGDFALVMVINEQAKGSASTPIQNAMLNVIWEALVELGADELATVDVNIFPNPAKGQIRIQLPEKQSAASLVLRDLQGREVLVQSVSTTGWVDVNDINQGLYLAEVHSHDGQLISVVRLVIQ